jgi:hypothetical protein
MATEVKLRLMGRTCERDKFGIFVTLIPPNTRSGDELSQPLFIHSGCARRRADCGFEAWDTAPLDAVPRNDYAGVIASASCSGA